MKTKTKRNTNKRLFRGWEWKWALFSIIILVGIYGITRISFYNTFEKDGGTLYIKARVYKKKIGKTIKHGSQRVYYRYKYDGKAYEGEGHVSKDYYPRISIGDSILIGISSKKPGKSKVADYSTGEITFINHD